MNANTNKKAPLVNKVHMQCMKKLRIAFNNKQMYNNDDEKFFLSFATFCHSQVYIYQNGKKTVQKNL